MKILKIKFCFLFLVIVFSAIFQSLQAQDFPGVRMLTERVAPWTKNKIVFHALSKSNEDRFELVTEGEKLHISATSSSAASMGFNYFLNHFCNQSVGHGASNLKALKVLPEIK